MPGGEDRGVQGESLLRAVGKRDRGLPMEYARVSAAACFRLGGRWGRGSL